MGNQKVADAVAKAIGITDPMGDLLPEDKVTAIVAQRKEVFSVETSITGHRTLSGCEV